MDALKNTAEIFNYNKTSGFHYIQKNIKCCQIAITNGYNCNEISQF